MRRCRCGCRCRAGKFRLMGRGRDGGARTAAAGAGRDAVSDVGPLGRSRARARSCPKPPASCFGSCDGRTLGPVPCFVKPLTRRALRRPGWPLGLNRLVSALDSPLVKVVARSRPLRAEARMVQRLDDRFTGSGIGRGEVLAGGPAGRAVPELEIRVAPHVRYAIAASRSNEKNVGYAVYRHLRTARPGHASRGLWPTGRRGWLQHAARLGRSGGGRRRLRQDSGVCLPRLFRPALRRSGFFQVKSTMQLVAKINAFDAAPAFMKRSAGGTSHSETRTRTAKRR